VYRRVRNACHSGTGIAEGPDKKQFLILSGGPGLDFCLRPSFPVPAAAWRQALFWGLTKLRPHPITGREQGDQPVRGRLPVRSETGEIRRHHLILFADKTAEK